MYIYCSDRNIRNLEFVEEPALFDTSNAVDVKVNCNLSRNSKSPDWELKLTTISGAELVIYRSSDEDEIEDLFQAVVQAILKKEYLFSIDKFLEEREA